MNYLLVIDDSPIRRAEFSNTEKLMNKLDRLDQALQVFRDQDQRLFSDWFDLTFREQREQIRELHEQYQALAKFHNWIIAESQIRDISPPEALLFLRQEEEFYSRGSDLDRLQIEKARKEREDFIRSEMEKEFNFDNFDDEDDRDEDDETELDDNEPPSNAEDQALLRSIRQMTDKKIRKICGDREGAVGLLSAVMGLSRSDEDHELVLRIWDLIPNQHQKAFAREFARETGQSVNKIIEEIRAYLADRFDGGSDDHEEMDSEFDDKFVGRDTSRVRSKAESIRPQEAETIKQLYRRLVRQLHPDLNRELAMRSQWHMKIWDRVQAAYRRMDRVELEKILRLVLIRRGSLNDLTVSEIRESQSWLESELESLNHEAADLKRSPAWGFSRRKDFGTLKKKLARPLLEQMSQIEDQINELKAQHEIMEMLAVSDIRRQRKPRPRKASKPRSRKATRAKRGTGNSVQTSFFD